MAKIIQINPNDDIPVTPRKHYPKCKHNRAWVDEKIRCLVCRNCGAIIDPFDWIMQMAEKDYKLMSWRGSLKNERDELQKELEKLKREEGNIKARIKRLKGKVEER